MWEENEETIRWPTDLDRAAIEKRLAYVGELAKSAGLEELAAQFRDVAGLSAGKIATRVVAALTAILDMPEEERARYGEISRQLEMVAMNLKNL